MTLKKYIAPDMATQQIATQRMLMGSTLDNNPTSDEQNITPTNEEYGGEFKSRRRNSNVWDDRDEEEENEKAY